MWSHLAGFFLEGNGSICYKKAACDLTPGPCCSLPLSARRARDTEEEEGERERNEMGWWAERWRSREEAGERCQDRGREQRREKTVGFFFLTSHLMKAGRHSGPVFTKRTRTTRSDVEAKRSLSCRVVQAAPDSCNEGEVVLKNHGNKISNMYEIDDKRTLIQRYVSKAGLTLKSSRTIPSI